MKNNRSKLFVVILFLAHQTIVAQPITDAQRACMAYRAGNGLPLFSAHGVSGYSRNLCTGKLITGNEEVAAMNRRLKQSWKRLGYTCSVDCSGHEAGREWAEENNISDPGDCPTTSRSFYEGCEAHTRFSAELDR